MARQGENIYQRKNGRWEGKYIKDKINGRIRYGYVSGNSYDEVLQKKKRAAEAYEESVKKNPFPEINFFFPTWRLNGWKKRHRSSSRAPCANTAIT